MPGDTGALPPPLPVAAPTSARARRVLPPKLRRELVSTALVLGATGAVLLAGVGLRSTKRRKIRAVIPQPPLIYVGGAAPEQDFWSEANDTSPKSIASTAAYRGRGHYR